jgi:glycosyltransferase involved in cell wall biosynthesis
MRKIFYLPLEPLPERYTVQLSAAGCGWLEWRWRQHDIPYERIEGEQLTSYIKHGSVLDANGRGFWALSQIKELLRKIDAGEVTSDDVIYFDDFWHPGISALPYSFHLTGVRPKMFAMLHAQSVDVHDFTYPMRHWMRPFEIGIGRVLSGIFVTSTCLRDLCLYAGIGTPETVHLCGLPYNSDEVRTHLTTRPSRKNQVVYSSRWDKEKRPDIFLQIVDEVVRWRPDISFVVTTSAKELRSNDESLRTLLAEYLEKYPDNLTLRVGQTKEQYYTNLLESKVQINTADQDFVSWTMLEATTCGCYPLYPYFLSFPEALEYHHEFMYVKNDVRNAAFQLIRLVDAPEGLLDVDWVYKKYDKSWERMYNVMNDKPYEPLYRNSHAV